MNTKPSHGDLSQAPALSSSRTGVELTGCQMNLAAETDAQERRTLPFFVDAIEGRLKIERQALINAYRQKQVTAERNLRIG